MKVSADAGHLPIERIARTVAASEGLDDGQPATAGEPKQAHRPFDSRVDQCTAAQHEAGAREAILKVNDHDRWSLAKANAECAKSLAAIFGI